MVFFKIFVFFCDCVPLLKDFSLSCFCIQLYSILSHSIYLKTKFSICWFQQVDNSKANGSYSDASSHKNKCLSIRSCNCMSINFKEKPPKTAVWALSNIVVNTGCIDLPIQARFPFLWISPQLYHSGSALLSDKLSESSTLQSRIQWFCSCLREPCIQKIPKIPQNI